MSRKQLGFLLLLLGVALLIGGTAALVKGVLNMVESFKPLAVLASPGEVAVEIEEAGPYTLWHDHKTWHNGTSVSNPSTLPGGFSFSMREAGGSNGSNSGPAFTPNSPGVTETFSTGSRESTAVGVFDVPTPGTYLLQASDPASELRIFSLSQGKFLDAFGGFFIRLILFGLLAVLGFALAIGAVLLLTLGRRKSPPPPPSA